MQNVNVNAKCSRVSATRLRKANAISDLNDVVNPNQPTKKKTGPDRKMKKHISVPVCLFVLMFHSTNMDRLTYQQTILYLYPSGLDSLSMRGCKHSSGREWGPEGEHTRLMSKEDPRMTDDEQREGLSSHREIYSAYSRKVPSLAYMLPEYHICPIYLSIYLSRVWSGSGCCRPV